jgi:aspartyl-tRNA(Asn)/glutamyl-tRNA(Gln) amidotransferase subunit A
MLNVIAGYDELDPTSVNMPVVDYTRSIRLRPSRLRVGVPRTPFYENLEPDVAKAMETALEVLRQIAGDVRDVQVPASPGLAPVSNAEIYAYHAPWITKTPELYQEATRRIVLGGADSKADVYAQGLRGVEIARREIIKVFESVDLLVTPTTGGVASLIPRPSAGSPSAPARASAGGGGGPAGFRNTSYFSFYGLPAISVPCGFTASGLPIGLQISGAPFAEATVLALAHAYEQATEWHERRPKLAL